MRIEGTYTFPAPIDRVCGALLDPAALTAALPDCERLIQLGPPSADDAVTFEARIRKANLAFRMVPIRRPGHLRLELRGRMPSGTFSGGGTIDLVAQEQHTLGAYALDVDAPGARPEAAQRVAGAVCERLAAELWHQAPEMMPAGDLVPNLQTPREVQTRRGRIVALPRLAPRASLASMSARDWLERALWMGAGTALGIGAIALALALVHRLTGREE